MPYATIISVINLYKFLKLLRHQYWVSYMTTQVGSHALTPVIWRRIIHVSIF